MQHYATLNAAPDRKGIKRHSFHSPKSHPDIYQEKEQDRSHESRKTKQQRHYCLSTAIVPCSDACQHHSRIPKSEDAAGADNVSEGSCVRWEESYQEMTRRGERDHHQRQSHESIRRPA